MQVKKTWLNLFRNFGSERDLLVGKEWDNGRGKATLVIDNNLQT